MAKQGFTLEELKQRGARISTPAGPVNMATGQAQNFSASPVADKEKTRDGGFLGKTSSFFDVIFGGGKVGEAIGTELAKGTFGETAQRFAVGREMTPEEEEGVGEGPTFSEVAGDVLRTGALFTPIGRIAGAVSKGAQTIGRVGNRVGDVIGRAVGGGAAGGAADIGIDLSEGDAPSLGLGATLGVGIPVASPVAKALGRATKKVASGVGKGFAELQGAITGTSEETLTQAFRAAREGGESLEDLTSALRSKTTPESLVNSVRENIDVISSRQQNLFRETLNELGDTVVTTDSVKREFTDILRSSGVTTNDDGLLNFANSKLRTTPSAQTKLQSAWDEVRSLPEETSLKDLDTTRQAINSIKKIAGDDPSSNLANKLIDDAVRSVRRAGEQVDGYGQMLDNFGETAGFLSEIERGLSLGDRSTIDQAYRKLITSLKTNNERRMALVEELDRATGGAVLSEVAGQQLSEWMPRGIIRAFAASLGAVGFGMGSSPTAGTALATLAFASPRVQGEFVRALGIGARKADELLTAIGKVENELAKLGAIIGSEQSGEEDN